MTRTYKVTKALFLVGIGLWGLFLSGRAFAQEDPGLIRALQTDSAHVENSYYILASFQNDTTPYHWVYLYGEGLFVLGKDLGLEADFPLLDTWEPLGTQPVVLGPIGLNLRYEFYHFGGWSSETAGAFALSGGAAYGIANKDFPWIGSSWTLEVLGGYRIGKFFLQGNYGFQGRIDPQVSSIWSANTALGYHFLPDWYLQTEADLSDTLEDFGGATWTFIPQIAFQPDEWLFEFGECFNVSPVGITEIMIARTF